MQTNLKKLVSKEEIVVKYIFPFLHNVNAEFVYLDNNSGKDIICIPSQTGCNLGCKFCHLTARGTNQKVHQLDPQYSFERIKDIVENLGLPLRNNRTLLISFMGMGEPLLDPSYILYLSDFIKEDLYLSQYTNIKFGLATIIPTVKSINEFTKSVYYPTKIHWSLHNVFDDKRKLIMPKALPIKLGIEALKFYQKTTGNPVEIHYTIFEGNNSIEEADELSRISKENSFPIKFLKFSERPDKELLKSNPFTTQEFINRVIDNNCRVEIYKPPGQDIYAACGEFEHN